MLETVLKCSIKQEHILVTKMWVCLRNKVKNIENKKSWNNEKWGDGFKKWPFRFQTPNWKIKNVKRRIWAVLRLDGFLICIGPFFLTNIDPLILLPLKSLYISLLFVAFLWIAITPNMSWNLSSKRGLGWGWTTKKKWKKKS